MSRLTILCLFLFFSAVLAAPLNSRTVQTVTWNATGIPAGITGKIQLGYLDPNSEGEHLSTILADGFNLTDEKVDITVPPVQTRTTYILVLFGDSGNASPEFTIQGSSSSSSASGPGSPTTSSTFVGTSGSPPSSLSSTPTPPISVGSSGFSAPISTSTAPSSVLRSPSSSLPTSASVAATSGSLSPSLFPSPSPSPSPSPNTGAAWSMKNLKTYQVVMTPALALLLFI
ncbi:hypothetical protein MVEN_00373600 [Mycena venus]|uniref:Uncharacterized protein n=1 Tax=Mycena venus TaxID=2733690 RepID=A0A8H6YPU5_9AGAR|nr:hypothetical protein MVEN_00373600 [Mycena venus]